MEEHKIPYFNYIQTDIEIEFQFYAIDIVAKLLKAKTFGASIDPFSSKNFPKSKEIVLPSDELIRYKEIVSCVPQSKTLILHKITISFLESIVQSKLRKTDVNYNYKDDMKKCLMSIQRKEYIYYKGFWNEYLVYLQNEMINI